MIAEGKHRAKCTGSKDAQWGRSQNGNVKLALDFILTEDPYRGTAITWIGTMTDNTVERILETLENCGLEHSSSLDELRGIDQNEVELDIVHETDENTGRTYARVKWVNRPSSGRMRFREGLPPAEVKRSIAGFDALWRAKARSSGAPPQARRNPSRSPEPVDSTVRDTEPPPGRFDDDDPLDDF